MVTAPMLLRFGRDRYASDVAPRLLLASAELILDALPPLVPHSRFLEVSAGAGPLARPLVDRIAGLGRLVAVDVDWGLVQHLPSMRGRAARALAEPDRLPFPDRTFDVVLANLCLGDELEDGARLAELSRLVQRGGWVLATVLVRGSFDVLLDVLTETSEAGDLLSQGQALVDARRSFPEENAVQLALADVDLSPTHLGIEERGLFFENGTACLEDPFVKDVLLPSWLADSPPLPPAALAAAARALDDRFRGGRFALRVRTAVVTGRPR